MKVNYIRVISTLPVTLEKLYDGFSQMIESSKFLQASAFHIEHSSRIFNTIDFISRIDSRFDPLKTTATKYLHGHNLQTIHPLFSKLLKETTNKYKSYYKPFLSRLSYLDTYERKRIDESFHSLKEKCYWSSVLNSSVAIEHRLLKLLSKENESFLRSKKKNLDFTLGALVSLYTENKSSFNNCIPKLHDGLMKLVNDYRIISAHSKKRDITKSNTEAVFNLVIAFLIDPDCRR